MHVASSAPYRTLIFWLYAEPDALDKRLDDRVDKMVEVSQVYHLSLVSKLTTLQISGDC